MKIMFPLYQISWTEDFAPSVHPVPQVGPKSGLVEYYTQELPEVNLNEVVIFATHIKALRTFLDSTDQQAIIWEGPLSENLFTKLSSYVDNLPDNWSLICLDYELTNWEKTTWVGQDAGQENLFSINWHGPPDILQGPFSFLITREYAMEALAVLDRPWRFLLPDYRSMTSILTLAQPVFAYPGLAEEIPVDVEEVLARQPSQDHVFEFI